MTDRLTLADLGWSDFFLSQCDSADTGDGVAARVSAVHRAGVSALTTEGPRELLLPPECPAGDIAVGDWLLADPATGRAKRLLDRRTLLKRGNDNRGGATQLIAANVDTLFITTSCNADFNVARLERYLALAHEAGSEPVILLTKADQAEDAADFLARAAALGRHLPVLALNAKSPDATAALADWCGPGQTVALVGTSGVGKTTLANALTGGAAATQAIREDDARGRHTTTARSLHRMAFGGWLIDTPGMRALGLADAAAGIAATFAEITELEAACKFRDCQHESEPGCAVQAAIAAGEIDPDRLMRYRKLQREDAQATETVAQARARTKKFGKMVKSVQSRKKR